MRYLRFLLPGLLLLAVMGGGATADSSQPPLLIDVIDVGSGAVAVATNPNDNRIYVVAYHDNAVSVIDSVSHDIVATIAVADGLLSVAVNTTTNRIYVAHGFAPTSLTVIDGTTLTVVDTMPLGLGSFAGTGLAVNSSTDRVYATSPFEDVVAVLDGTTGTVLATIPVGGGPIDVDVNMVTNRIFVRNGRDDSISVIDGATNSVISTIAVNSGLTPGALVVNHLTNRIYVANLADTAWEQGSVSVIDGDSEEVVAVLPMDTHAPGGDSIQGLGVDAGANRVYLTDGGPYVTDPGVLKVIDGAANEVVSAIMLDPRATGVAVNPQINRVYVAHSSNSSGVPGKVSILGLEGDGDEDGFADGSELHMGTNAVSGCAATADPGDEATDAWPVDFNDDQRAAMQDVIFAFVTTLAPGGLNQPAVGPLVRVDFNGDTVINMQDVIYGYVTKLAPNGLNTSCAP